MQTENKEEERPKETTFGVPITCIETDRFFRKCGSEREIDKLIPDVNNVMVDLARELLDTYEFREIGRMIAIPDIEYPHEVPWSLTTHLFAMVQAEEGDECLPRVFGNTRADERYWGILRAYPTKLELWEPAQVRDKLKTDKIMPWGVNLEFIVCDEPGSRVNPAILIERVMHNKYGERDCETFGVRSRISSCDDLLEAYKSLPRLRRATRRNLEVSLPGRFDMEIRYSDGGRILTLDDLRSDYKRQRREAGKDKA
ncbi:hypothetical protein HZB90_02700 [archaeon]|nr:hypothetical protein [archaeon]